MQRWRVALAGGEGFEEDLAGVVGGFDGLQEGGRGQGGLELVGVVKDAADGQHGAALACAGRGRGHAAN